MIRDFAVDHAVRRREIKIVEIREGVVEKRVIRGAGGKRYKEHQRKGR